MIAQLDLQRQHRALRDELLGVVARVLDGSRFILGDEGRALETEVARLAGVRLGIGVASGTDALRLALAALEIGPGDAVMTSAFSFVASADAGPLAERVESLPGSAVTAVLPGTARRRASRRGSGDPPGPDVTERPG